MNILASGIPSSHSQRDYFTTLTAANNTQSDTKEWMDSLVERGWVYRLFFSGKRGGLLLFSCTWKPDEDFIAFDIEGAFTFSCERKDGLELL